MKIINGATRFRNSSSRNKAFKNLTEDEGGRGFSGIDIGLSKLPSVQASLVHISRRFEIASQLSRILVTSPLLEAFR